MFRSTKRQRLEAPSSWMDCDSLATVVPLAVNGAAYVRTPVASPLTQEIFFDRFRKEIIDKYHWSLSSQLYIAKDTSVADCKTRRALLRQRIQVGTNACSWLLSGHHIVPRLVVVCNDQDTAKQASHIPVMARECHVPILLLQGDCEGEGTSRALGKLLGVKTVSMLAFLPRTTPVDGFAGTQLEQEVHDSLDSFVDFLLQKVQG